MTQKVPLVLINLDRDDDRLAAFRSRAASCGLSFDRLPAIAGDEMTSDEKARLCPDRRLWWRRQPLSDGEIGCFASPLAAYRRIVAGNDDVVCIAEDDIAFSPEFARILASDIELPDGVGILKLEGSPHRLPRLGVTVGTLAGCPITVYAIPSWRTGAYLVTRAAAGQLLDRLVRMAGPLDQVLFEPWRTGVVVAELRPFPAWQDDQSRIDPEGERGSPDWQRFLLTIWRVIRGHLWLTYQAALR